MDQTYWLRYRGVRFPLRLGETILGRSPYCTVVIPDGEVSRTHATVRLTAGGPEIQDLNSSNGTRVNGECIDEPCLLKEGDLVGIGAAQLEVVTTTPESFSDTNRVSIEPLDSDAEDRSTLTNMQAVEKAKPTGNSDPDQT